MQIPEFTVRTARPSEIEQTASSSEAVLRHQVLLEQQRALVKQLVTAETELKSLDAIDVHALPPGTDKAMLERQYVGGRALVQELRAKLAETRSQLNAIESRSATTGQEAERIFGYRPFEFASVAFLALLIPLAIAAARLVWRRGSRNVISPPVDIDRFSRLEQAVDAIAIEMERVGESQRFVNKVLSDRVSTKSRSTSALRQSEVSKHPTPV